MKPMTRDQYVVLQYFVTALSNKHVFGRHIADISVRLAQISKELGIDVDAFIANHDDKPAKTWREIRRVINKRIAEIIPPDHDDIDDRINAISRIFGLSDVETKIFSLLARYNASDFFMASIDALIDETFCIELNPQLREEFSILLGIDSAAFRKAISKTSKLLTNGLVKLGLLDELELSSQYIALFGAERPPLEGLMDSIVGKPLTSSLSWDDYAHIGEQRDYLERLLRGAIQSRARGVNILIYGPPGTGKTEFSKVLASRVGHPIYAIGGADEDGSEPSRRDRLESLLSVQHLVGTQGKGVFLVDEAQDLFTAESNHFGRYQKAEGSRVFIHNVLESIEVPTIWTANQIADFGGPILRRMTHILELTSPPKAVRGVMWERILTGVGIEHRATDALLLADELQIPPAIASSAARSAAMSGGGLKDLRLSAKSLGDAVCGRSPPHKNSDAGFVPDLATANIDLDLITQRLSSPAASRRFSICSYGPPGTGKSEFARYLAKQLGMDVIFKRYSDLSSKWVGESEQKIASAFQEAAAARAMLIIDEADSLLGDRSLATRSWEVTQVNEMLTWMETHPYPFICTTNLMSRLDPASMRRFTFKIQFQYMTSNQINKAFIHFFGSPAPKSILGLNTLTAGDFSVAKNKALTLGCSDDMCALAELLALEQKTKPDQTKSIGFIP